MLGSFGANQDAGVDVAKLVMTVDEAAVHRVVGNQTFLHGQEYVRRGAVLRVKWQAAAGTCSARYRAARGSRTQPWRS
jgi:hypothetical protein